MGLDPVRGPGRARMIRARERRGRPDGGRMGEGTETSSVNRFFGVALRSATYARLFYLLVSFPIAIASWVALVVLLSVGGALAVTVVGIPILILTMFGWCFAADLERVLSNVLLQTRIRPLPFGTERTEPWPWRRLKARFTNSYTWRSLAFLLLVRFPLGIAGFVVATTVIGTVFNCLTAPVGVALGSNSEFFTWNIDSALEASLAFGAGLVLIFPALHVVSFAGWVSGRITAMFLQSPETATPQPLGDALERAATSAVRWPGILGRKLSSEAKRERSLHVRIWAVHAGLYGAVMLILLVIDAATIPDHWWILWPAWGWGMALALHTGYLLGGLLGGHALAFATANLGFFVIDAQFAESTWFFWPLISWAIGLAAHAYLYFGFAPIEARPILEPFDQA